MTVAPDGCRLWSNQDGSFLGLLPQHNLVRADFIPDSSRVLTRAGGGYLRLWNTESHTPVADLDGVVNSPYHVVFSPNSARILSVDDAGAAPRLWNVGDGRLVALLGNRNRTRRHRDSVRTERNFTTTARTAR